MKLINTVKYKDFQVYYVEHYYDIPLRGLCYYKGKLHFFKCLDWGSEDLDYEIYKMNFWEKLKKLYYKKKFEICIGYHWTYKNGKRTKIGF